MRRTARRRRRTNNQRATITATIAGVLLLLSGVTGASQWERTFTLIQEVLGASPLIRFVGLVFVALGSAGGILVLFGAQAFRRDRVRLGRTLIYLGTGFTIFSLLLFGLLILRLGELPFAGGFGLGLIGIVLSIVARFQAKPLPLGR